MRKSKQIKIQRDLLDLAWAIIANTNGGNWDLADDEWVKAAIDFRLRYSTL